MAKTAQWHIEGALTDEVVAKQRQRIGREMRLDNCRNAFVDPDNVTCVANAVGDRNPLWRDDAYAKETPWGARIALPSYLNILSTGEIMHGMPGVQAFHSSTCWEFYKPAYVHDKLHAQAKFIAMDEKRSTLTGRMLIEKYETLYYNQFDEVIAKNISGMVRVERAGIRGTSDARTSITVPHPWSDEERTRLEDETLASDVMRGAEPRYWEDSQVGEDLPTLVVAPLSMSDVMAWTTARSLMMTRGAQVAAELRRKHPGMAMLHPESNCMEWILIVHWDNIAARSTGLPGAYDLGAHRQAYQMHALTNWAGDSGWLKVSDCQYRGFVYIGDGLWFKGKVIDKYVDRDGEYCVDVRTSAVNQRGEDTMPGTNTIVLPSKTGFSPVTSRKRS